MLWLPLSQSDNTVIAQSEIHKLREQHKYGYARYDPICSCVTHRGCRCGLVRSEHQTLISSIVGGRIECYIWQHQYPTDAVIGLKVEKPTDDVCFSVRILCFSQLPAFVAIPRRRARGLSQAQTTTVMSSKQERAAHLKRRNVPRARAMACRSNESRWICITVRQGRTMRWCVLHRDGTSNQSFSVANGQIN